MLGQFKCLFCKHSCRNQGSLLNPKVTVYFWPPAGTGGSCPLGQSSTRQPMAAQLGPDSASPDSANPASGERGNPNRSKFTAEPLGWSTRIRGEAVADTASKVVMVMRYMAGFCTWFGLAQILERHLFGVWDTVVRCVWCGLCGPMCSVWTL